MKWHGVVIAFSLFAVVGCGGKKSDLTFNPVSGIVTLDGQPLAEADVSATPSGTTMGLGGGGRSNEKGEFQMTHARGEPGLPPGEYKVAISLRKRPDGTVPPPNDPTPPIESNAVETLPQYCDPATTTLTLTVPPTTTPVEFKLQGGKK